MNHHVCNFLEISTRCFHVLVWQISNLIMCKTPIGSWRCVCWWVWTWKWTGTFDSTCRQQCRHFVQRLVHTPEWNMGSCSLSIWFTIFLNCVCLRYYYRGVFPFEFVIGQMMTVQTTFFLLSSFESSPCQKRLDQGVLQVLYVKCQCPWLQWILINTAASWEIYYVVRLKDLVSFGCFSGGDFGAAIWRIPERGQGGNRVIPLQNVVNLQGHTHKIKWYTLSPFYSFLLAGCSWVCILITCSTQHPIAHCC